MKKILSRSAIFLFTLFFFSCKTNKNSSDATTPLGKYSGYVSFIYKKEGCSAVIITKREDEQELTLIPKDKLSKDFDVDNLKITFNYRGLKMPTPEGCKGIPAEITDLAKKK